MSTPLTTISKISKTQIIINMKTINYLAIGAIFDLSTTTKVIGLDDIRDTKADGGEVVICFNMDGAKKWAEMTKNNIGKPIAFAVDNKIIYTPTIASELRNGVAKIPGLDDDASAISLSESINASIPK